MKTELQRAVRAWRKKQGLTQAELAAQLDVSAPGLSMILSGQRRMTLAFAMKLEAVTGISVRKVHQMTIREEALA